MASVYLDVPTPGAPEWREPVPTLADLPTDGNQIGDVRQVLNTKQLLTWNGSAWVGVQAIANYNFVDSNSIDFTVAGQNVSAEVDTSSNAADAGNQKVALDIQTTGDTGLRAQIPQASTSVDGALKATDFVTFNNKQNALTFGSVSTSTTGVTVGSGANSTVGPNVTVNIQTATGAQPGLLSAADFTTFSAKQPAGSYITSLTGEVSATGPGAAAATISNAAVIGKAITGFSSGAGTLSPTDTIIQAFNKMDGNVNAAVATVTGKVNKVGDTMTGSLAINQTANAQLGIIYTVGNLNRFKATIAGAESGGQSGSDYILQRYDDAGAALGGPVFTIARSNGYATFFSNVYGLAFNATGTTSVSSFTGIITALKTITTTYTLDTTSTDSTILCNHAAAFTITLTTVPAGREINIKDITGQATSRPITISAGAATIDGQTTYVLSQNYGAIKLVSNGTNWFVL